MNRSIQSEKSERSVAKRRRIGIVTSSRADYGHVYWPMQELLARDDVDPFLIVTGAHLSPEFGLTVQAIEADGLPIAERIECLLSSDTDVAMGKTLGLATISFTEALDRQRPDLLVVVADRYEMLAPAMAAMTLRLPIVHVEGGELSEGAIDQQIRNALTMLSHVHLTTTELASRRLMAMGEQAHRIHRVGAASLDHLRRCKPMARDALSRVLDATLESPLLVVAVHAVTIERDTTVEIDAVFAALEQIKATIVFCFPNADAGSRRIMQRAKAFCKARDRSYLFVNLDRETYWSLLSCADAMLGNSSSGIMESPSLNLPAVNIGKRQQGRERAANVLDVPAQANEVVNAAHRALDRDFRRSLGEVTNPYGDGHAAERIATILAEVPIDASLLEKRGLPDELVRDAVPETRKR